MLSLKNSKQSFSTNIWPIYIQQSIQCTRDHCRHSEYRNSQNEHILIKLVIRVVYKLFLVLAVYCCSGNSKPSCSTILRLIPIQPSIQCTRDQCLHAQCQLYQNEYSLINGGMRMCKFSDASCGLIIRAVASKIPNHLSPPI